MNRGWAPTGRRHGGGTSTGSDRVAWLATPGIVALVAEPLLWLVRSWRDPSYQSDGALVACMLAALVAVSLASGRAPADPRARRTAWRLLLLTASIRLAGRLLAVHTVGALALVVDVAAVALLLGLRGRPFALSPWALAAFSFLALPVEHLAQRLLGHPLQLMATQVSYALLAPFDAQLARHGTLLVHPQLELAVDLPCSGARGLVLFAGLLLFALCRRRPTPKALVAAAATALGGALAANVIRIVLLFVGGRDHLPANEEPWHGAVGTLALMIGAAPLLLCLMDWPRRCAQPARPHDRAPFRVSQRRRRAPVWWVPVCISLLGGAIAMAPARPLDVSRAAAPRSLPAHLGPLSGEPVPLSKSERLYYARYGGQADKRTYRDAEGTPLTVLRVHTGSPLRHLHGPDRCLLGAGHRVTRLGVVRGSAPSVLYRSVAPDGAAWRVEASFMSDDGRFATGVSEVVWLWLERPDVAWSLIERITPWSLCASEPALCHDFERSLFRSLEPLAEPPQLAALGGAMQSPFLTPDHQGALSCDPVCPPPTGPPIRPAAR